jgi:hypothetical protein
MTPTVILNLIVSIAAIAGVAALMRAAYVASGEPVAELEVAPEPAVELERAA